MHRRIRAARTLAPAMLTLIALGLVAGCGTGRAPKPAPSAAPTPAPTEQTTDRALAAAIIDHVALRPSVASPLFDSKDARRGAAVDFPTTTEGPDLSISVVVERKPGPTPTCGDHRDCETARVGARTVLLAWDEAVPGEDEGDWFVRTRLGSTLVTLRANGPLIDRDPRSGRLGDLTDDLREVVADPAVGFTTSTGYVRAGRAIPAGVWRSYFG